MTPWVRRLLVSMGIVYLLQLTVFTNDWLIETFGFIPALVLRHPWSALTYAFLHANFLHILFNAITLYMFGRPVESRLGGASFIRLFTIAALGGAALSLLMWSVGLMGNAVTIGASGGIFGVLLAFVLEWPDAPVLVFPLPFPIKAKWIVVFFAAISLTAGILGVHDGVAHFAHLGGFAAALLYLRGPALLRRAPRAPAEGATAVLVHPFSTETARGLRPFGPRRRGADTKVLEEVDRVLDKISAGGLSSLTPEERRFLDEMSKRFKQDP